MFFAYHHFCSHVCFCHFSNIFIFADKISLKTDCPVWSVNVFSNHPEADHESGVSQWWWPIRGCSGVQSSCQRPTGAETHVSPVKPSWLDKLSNGWEAADDDPHPATSRSWSWWRTEPCVSAPSVGGGGSMSYWSKKKLMIKNIDNI